MAGTDQTPTGAGSTGAGYEELGPVEAAVTEAERNRRADAVYARYSAAMTFFGETPAPKGKTQRS